MKLHSPSIKYFRFPRPPDVWKGGRHMKKFFHDLLFAFISETILHYVSLIGPVAICGVMVDPTSFLFVLAIIIFLKLKK